MIEDKAHRLAALHATAFRGAARWSADAFGRAMTDPRCFFVMDEGETASFALGRIAADEVELLTLIVAPLHRRRGLGRSILARFEEEARTRGATSAFLEVAADNVAARALYMQTGWRRVGKRPGYYDDVDAFLMRKDLGAL